jgi:ribonuclease E
VVTEAAAVIESQTIVAEPQVAEVETDPEVITAPVDAEPQIVPEAETVVAEQVTEEAEPAAPAAVVTEDVVVWETPIAVETALSR